MARLLSFFFMLSLVLAAQQASAQTPIVLGNSRIRLEVRPQVIETDMGKGAFAASVGVDGEGAQGTAMLTTPLGLLHMRITDGMVICGDDGLTLMLQAFGLSTPQGGRSVKETELLILITPRLVPSSPRDTRANDILIGGLGSEYGFVATGRWQIVGEMPCPE